MPNWCPLCCRFVPSHHKHWGRADYFCHPITGLWECLHCGRPVGDHRSPGECRQR